MAIREQLMEGERTPIDMTHRTNAPPSEKQKVMLGLLSRPGKWWEVSQLQEEFNLTEGTIRSALREFENQLGIVEHDRPKYRIYPGKEYEAWVFIQYGWEGFETSVRANVDNQVVVKSEVEEQDIGINQYR